MSAADGGGECPCGRARAGCEYNDPNLQIGSPEPCESDGWGDPDDPNNPPAFGGAGSAPTPAGLNLLGPDAPEVSTDLIYLDPATGGLVSVPQVPERPSLSMYFEGRPITVHPEPYATAAEVARLIAAAIPGAWVEADGTIFITRPAPNWRASL